MLFGTVSTIVRYCALLCVVVHKKALPQSLVFPRLHFGLENILFCETYKKGQDF